MRCFSQSYADFRFFRYSRKSGDSAGRGGFASYDCCLGDHSMLLVVLWVGIYFGKYWAAH